MSSNRNAIKSGNNPIGGATTNRTVSLDTSSADSSKFSGGTSAEWQTFKNRLKTAIQGGNAFEIVDLARNPTAAAIAAFRPPNPIRDAEAATDVWQLPAAATHNINNHQYTTNVNVFRYDPANPPPKNPKNFYRDPVNVTINGVITPIFEDVVPGFTEIPETCDYELHDMKRRRLRKLLTRTVITTMRDVNNYPATADRQTKVDEIISDEYDEFLKDSNSRLASFQKTQEFYHKKCLEHEAKVNHVINTLYDLLTAEALSLIEHYLIDRRPRAAYALLLSHFEDTSAHNQGNLHAVVNDLEKLTYDPAVPLNQHFITMEKLFTRWSALSGGGQMPEQQKIVYFKKSFDKCKATKFQDRLSFASLVPGVTYQQLKDQMTIYEGEWKSSSEGIKYLNAAAAAHSAGAGRPGKPGKSKPKAQKSSNSLKPDKPKKEKKFCQHCNSWGNHDTSQCYSQQWCFECQIKGHPTERCRILIARNKEELRKMIEDSKRKGSNSNQQGK